MNKFHVNVTSEQAMNHTPYCAPLVPHVCLTRATYEESLCRRFHLLLTTLSCAPRPRSALTQSFFAISRERRQARERFRCVRAFCISNVCLFRLLRSDLRVVIFLHGFDNMQGLLLLSSFFTCSDTLVVKAVTFLTKYPNQIL